MVWCLYVFLLLALGCNVYIACCTLLRCICVHRQNIKINVFIVSLSLCSHWRPYSQIKITKLHRLYRALYSKHTLQNIHIMFDDIYTESHLVYRVLHALCTLLATETWTSKQIILFSLCQSKLRVFFSLPHTLCLFCVRVLMFITSTDRRATSPQIHYAS